MSIFQFDWKAFEAAWSKFDNTFVKELRVGLLHAVKRAHQQPRVSVENTDELIPVNAAVTKLIEIAKQGQDEVCVTALRFAAELSTAEKYSYHHMRVTEETALNVMTELIKLGREFYQRGHSNKAMVNITALFLEQFLLFHESKFAYPDPTELMPKEWVKLCIVSGNMEALERVKTNSECLVVSELRSAILAAVITEQKWPEILRGRERTDVVNFSRRWILALLMFKIRAGM